MQSLKTIWKRLQFEMAASNIFDPPEDIMDAMKKDGWSFKTEIVQPVMSRMTCAGAFTYIAAYTPEGESVPGGDDETYKRYRRARREAAQQIFGMK